MAGPAMGVNVQAAMRGAGIGKGPLRPESRVAEEDPPELRIFADPEWEHLDTAGTEHAHSVCTVCAQRVHSVCTACA